MLLHERRGRGGAPTGLDLAFSTPRAWLADGKTIGVQNAPTSFGKVSYSIERAGSAVTVRAVVPPHAHARLRLRLPAGDKLRSVTLGGSRPVFDAASGTIDLGSRHGALTLNATVRR
jgi:hypothetical protein